MNLKEALKNSQGKIFYGMHFCPGVAQYDNAEGSFKVFLNEATIRKMNPTFAGRPMFVEHVDEVEGDLNQLRNEADGWVIESFYNEADGKTWAKFIIVSDRGFTALRKGFRLSNAYIPELTNTTGVWNGVTYQKLVTDGEFEHLAIVQNPRYDESVIMSPDEFKMYNENLKVELKRLANSKSNIKEKTEMKLNIFKRTKVENSLDLDGMVVELPLSKKEVLLTKVVNEYDKIVNMNGYANGDHMVKVGEKDEMSVNDLVKKHMETCNAFEEMKAKNAAGEDGGEPGKGKDKVDPQVENEEVDIGGEGERDDDGDKSLDNDDDSVDNADNADDADEAEEPKKKDDKKAVANAKAKAKSLKNAHLKNDNEELVRIDLPSDQIARGKALYGSN